MFAQVTNFSHSIIKHEFFVDHNWAIGTNPTTQYLTNNFEYCVDLRAAKRKKLKLSHAYEKVSSYFEVFSVGRIYEVGE